MRQIFQLTVLAAIFAVTSCNTEQAKVEQNIKMYTQTWDEILNKGNIDLIDTKFSEDYTLKTVTQTIKGKDAAKKHFGTYLTAFSNIEFIV